MSGTVKVGGRPFKRLKHLLALMLFGSFGQSMLNGAWAERFAFRLYGTPEGLTNLSGECMNIYRGKQILVCSEHGLFSYDGRQFVNLGPAQGLREGGVVYDLTASTGGRLAVRYADELFLSDPIEPGNASPNSLFFRPVNPGNTVPFFRPHRFQIAPFRGGFAVLVGHRTMQVVIPSNGQSYLAPIGYNAAEQTALEGPVAVFSVRGQIWETFQDGHLCLADPGFVRCYGPKQGLGSGPWEDVAAGPDGTVLARSITSLATINTVTGDITEEMLPDQGGIYLNYATTLGLFRMRNGELFTQSAGGLIIRTPSGWTELTRRDGIPSGVLADAADDRNGQPWFQVFNRGLYMGLGYGHWETLQENDGLSGGLSWRAVRAPNGSIWVSTDMGVDELQQIGGELQVVRVVPGPSYALGIGPSGNVWSSAGETNTRIIDPATGRSSIIATPPVNAIVTGKAGRVWLATELGLYAVDVEPGTPLSATRDGASTSPIVDLLSDGSGGVWMLSDGKLWHRPVDGSRLLVVGRWPAAGFEPVTMALAPAGHLWVGGNDGLYDLTLSGDHVRSCVSVPQSDIGSSAVAAMRVDHRGWVWVGTSDGVSVFNGQRWVSADTNLGLIWNDVSEGGITEDRDGSMWIVTSRGVSHLRDPAWLFSRQQFRVVIAEATLGDNALPSGRLPYSKEPLSIDFGTFDYAAEKSVVFRYRLSGVDARWTDSASGTVRYPFIPPGRHVLTVVGYDSLSHQTSPPVTLTIRMEYPWWDRWWADVLYVAVLACLLVVAVRWRERDALLRERKLEALVEERTREMRAAQAELKRQAALDGLTGVFNRTEVERRLAEGLSSGAASRNLVLAMVDLDHFKRINDEHGHLAGDDVLKSTGVRVAAILRHGEYAGRYGGEEFLLVLDDGDGQGASRLLVLHQSIRQAPFHLDEVSIAVTCSIGIAWAGPGDTWKSLVRRADAALYEAKNAGRDRIVERREDQVR